MKKIYALCVLFLALACKKDNDETPLLSSEKNILSFTFTVEGTTYSSTISNTSITAQLPEDTNLTSLTPTITFSKGATVTPNSGVAQDFSKEVSYTVTAEDKSTKIYKVLVTTEKTPQPNEPIEIGHVPNEPIEIGHVPNEYTTNKAGGEIVYFDVNTLPVKKEQIKVELVKRRSPFDVYTLKVQKIDKKERRVYVVLPNSYKNGEYYFKATFDKEEVESGDFTLDSGEIVLNVLDVIRFEPVTSLATTELQTFKTVVYANTEALKKYTYYLRKGTHDYQLTVSDISNYNLEFKMFNTPTGAFSGGNDFKFVVKGGIKEQVLAFVNSEKQPITIEPVRTPVIKTLSKTTLKAGDELTVTGEYFAYIGMNFDRNYRFCTLLLMQGNEVKATLYPSFKTPTEAAFKIENDVPAGKYKVVLSSQIQLKSEPFSQEVTIQKTTATPSARLKVTKAEIIDKNATFFRKQVMITFNETIDSAAIEAIVFPNLRIENVIRYPKTISSHTLSDDEYNYLVNNLPKGYVLIEENGKEYQAEFSLVKGN
ncbi:glycoside hydrolase xylanase [Capnocytophaga sputigena]|uniref:glycoside hydrolase xylanase n=1 Tax=Capnocytophaga sputigena TaxID=1019 RepID=UPI0028EBC682|nr:glycoside hydrolase xylanase [Capnocytophaga sputigena]